MKNADLIRRVAANANVTQEIAKRCIAAYCGVLQEALCDEDSEVVIHGIGKLAVVGREARIGRNPRTGEAVEIPAGARVKFTASTVMREAVNGAHRPAPTSMPGGPRYTDI